MAPYFHFLWRRFRGPTSPKYSTILNNIIQYSTVQYSIWTLKSLQCAQTSSQSYNIILYGTDFKAHILPVW